MTEDMLSGRRQAIDSAFAVIEGLWPSSVKDKEIKRRLLDKLAHIHDKGLIKKTIDSLADTQEKRPDNIIAALMHHYKIIAGPQAEPTDKDDDRPLADLRPRNLGPIGNWFFDHLAPAVCGKNRNDMFRAVDHEAVVEAFRKLLHDRKCPIRQDQRIEIEHVVHVYDDEGLAAFRKAWGNMKVVP